MDRVNAAQEAIVTSLLREGWTDADDVWAAIAPHLTNDEVRVAREEFDALPGSFLENYASAAVDAHSHGKRITLVSAPPDKPLDAARAGRVVWTISYDKGGVEMLVSHVHGHHAEWFANTEAVAT